MMGSLSGVVCEGMYGVPVKDSANKLLADGHVEKVFVEINGTKQGMFISSTSDKNPVLLFVHGGPGMPEYFLNGIYPTGLEKYFTVCWWDQRGAGLSYSNSLDYANITVEQNIKDIVSVINYLRTRYTKKKVFLLAHSWGTFIGIQAVEEFPEYFYAYIGVGQHSNQKESEKIAYRYMMNEFSEQKNQREVKKLAVYKNLDSDEKTLVQYSNSSVRDQAMHAAGIGTMHTMKSVVTGVFLPSLLCTGYTLQEKINLWKGKIKIARYTKLREVQLDTDLTCRIKKIAVPVIFMSGRYDYTVNADLSKAFLEKIAADDKAFILFENSAHSPLFEERDTFLDEMVRIKERCENE
jgi:pimeloyl-ACP methyl ester carboxylesterase